MVAYQIPTIIGSFFKVEQRANINNHLKKLKSFTNGSAYPREKL